MRKRTIERWMLSFLVLLTASECHFVAVMGSCDSFLVIRVSATDSHRYARIGNPTVSASMVGQPAYAATITRAPADSTVTEIRGAAGSYDVTVGKPGYSSVTQRAVVSGRGSCLSPHPVDLDVLMTRLP